MHLLRYRTGIVAMLAVFVVSVSWMAGCASHPANTANTSAPSAETAPAASAAEPAPAPPPPPPPASAAPRSPLHSLAGPTAIRHARAPKPAGSAAPAATSDEYALGDAVEAWKNSLKTGGIEYQVPTSMTAQLASPVTVDVHGYQDAQTHSLPNATGSDQLKVSSKMKVELYAVTNPDEFTIKPTSGDAIQFVPNDGHATWTWDVTPTNEATNQQLGIRVSLVYQQGSNPPVTQILEEKTYTVSVTVQKLTTTVLQSFWKDPLAWFKYMLPGGAGWGALAALVGAVGGLGFWKKKRKKAAISRRSEAGAAKGDEST